MRGCAERGCAGPVLSLGVALLIAGAASFVAGYSTDCEGEGPFVCITPSLWLLLGPVLAVPGLVLLAIASFMLWRYRR